MVVRKWSSILRLLLTGLAVLMMTGLAGSAQAAGTQILTFLGGKSGKTLPRQVSINGGATFSGPFSVGVYRGTLSAEPALGEIEMFCADIYHTIATPFETLVSLGRVIHPAQPLQASGFYEDGAGNGGGLASAMTAADYAPTLPGPNPAFDTIEKRANAVSYLSRTYLNAGLPTTDANRALLSNVQLAIWDIVQDGGDGANQGLFQAKTADGSAFVDLSAILGEAAGQPGAPGPRWIQAQRAGSPSAHAQDLIYLGPDPVQVCGTVFCDKDKDNFRDADELGIEGVEIVLEGDVDSDGNPDTLTTATDKDGRYCFADLEPGNYTVTVVVPSGSTLGSPASINVAATTPGTVYDGNDFWFINCFCDEKGKICGILFCDKDNDGKRDWCEPVLKFAPVWLKDANGNVIQETKTDCYGRYCFRDLKPGTYMVCVREVVCGLLVVGGACATVQVECGKTTYKSFAYRGGAICGYAYYDKNKNGRKDADEYGLACVWIKLRDSWGNYRWARTDRNGYYCFDDCLPGGSYKVYAPLCVDDKRLSTTNPLYVSIAPGEQSNNNNFGYRRY